MAQHCSVFRILLIRQRKQAINAPLVGIWAIVPLGAVNAAQRIAIVENSDNGLSVDIIATLEVLVAALQRL